MRKLSLHSDGTPNGTTILTEEGEALTHVAHASIEIDARDGVAVTLEVGPANLNITGTHATSMFECQICSVTFDHECDTRIGGGPGTFMPNDAPMLVCNSFLVYQDPYYKAECIRQTGHNLKHFDGERVWSD